jgi:putative SOS response-associated peptidase YedK
MQALAELAAKHDMTVQLWRELSADGKRYRLSISAGYHGGVPCVCWQQVFPVDHPLAQAVDRVAGMAWDYYAGTGYAIPAPGEGLLPKDVEATRIFGHNHPRVKGPGRIETIWTSEDPAEDDVCGRYRDTRSWAEHREMLASLTLPIVAPEAALNLEPRETICPTDQAVIVRGLGGGVELVRARWWLVPWFHRGALKDWKLATFNARAEKIATSRTFRDSFKRRRCLVSADGWYEWTGPKGEKQMWLFEPKDRAPIAFAGLWDRCDTADQGVVESFTIITQPAGSPFNSNHDRAPVVLFQEEWRRWLDLDVDAGDLLGPESADRFEVSPCPPQRAERT